jgi:outer membrane protein OmpA-like peptidoglycan-associated protein
MKRNIALLLLALVFLMPYVDVNARRKKGKKLYAISYLGGYVGGGYSQLMHDIPNTTTPGGGTGLLGFEYFLKYGKHFNFHLGLEGMYFNSLSKMNDFSIDSKFYYNDPLHNNLEIDYYMDFMNYREQHNNFSLNVPLMLGGEFKQFYFALGAKAKYGLIGNYFTNTNLTTWARDPEFIEDLENLPNHNISLNNLRTKGHLSYGLDVTASAELGIILDKWMSNSATIFGGVRNRKNISYRLGLFADYGVLNVRKNFAHDDIILGFPDMQAQADGRYVVPAASIGAVYNNSMLASDLSKEARFNSFVVGVKFTVLVQVSDTPIEPKKKERKRPTVHNVVLKENPIQEFVCGVRDERTGQPLSAQVSIIELGEQRDTLLVENKDKELGIFALELNKTKNYLIAVSKEGYIGYKDTVASISDTLYIDLKPIKKNTIIVLKKLFFDTNKTTIKNTSAESLDEMYRLLVDNPQIKIMITGHTDNVASDAYNLRLSEGRAKAVYDEMINRGIDPKRIKWQGKGEREPIDTNATEEGRAANRRVEFKIL